MMNYLMKKIDKPWGFELIYAHTDKYVGKILHINLGHALSLQFHNQKDETIYIQSGKIKFEYYWNIDVGGRGPSSSQEIEMNPGDLFHIKPGLCHRMTAIEDTDILEVSTPELDDIVRLEDRYGRVK